MLNVLRCVRCDILFCVNSCPDVCRCRFRCHRRHRRRLSVVVTTSLLFLEIDCYRSCSSDFLRKQRVCCFAPPKLRAPIYISLPRRRCEATKYYNMPGIRIRSISILSFFFCVFFCQVPGEVYQKHKAYEQVVNNTRRRFHGTSCSQACQFFVDLKACTGIFVCFSLWKSLWNDTTLFIKYR